MKKKFLIIISILLWFGAYSFCDAKKMYKWVDAQGQTHFSDRRPTKQSITTHEELNGNAQVTKTIKVIQKLPINNQSSQANTKTIQVSKHQKAMNKRLLRLFNSLEEMDHKHQAYLKNATIRLKKMKQDLQKEKSKDNSNALEIKIKEEKIKINNKTHQYRVNRKHYLMIKK